MTVLEATSVALEAAHLTDSEGPDAGVVAVLLRLARTIDAMDTAADDVEADAPKRKPFDNVTIPTYLKYAEALGLTVASRKAKAAVEEPQGGAAGGGDNQVSLAQVIELAKHAQG